VREWLEKARADVLIEATPVDVQTGQPAIEHVKAALEMGAHAVTANKGPVVHAFQELSDLAEEKKKKFLYEATVMDGAPIFSLFPLGLPAMDLQGFAGVLNSTTNVVLTEIEKGRSFDEGVKRAQAIGVAEAHPTNDLDGWDSAVKTAALVIVLMGVPIKLEQVQRTGIRELSEEKIRSARTAGVREGDVIVALDDKPVAGVDDLHRLLTDAQVGVRCTLSVIRHTERRTLSVIPEEAR
jgi:homoserine dehydrogenase